ncbi:MAG: hypothetical protein NZ935_14010, partial [Planctomycetes bacterium]|nr:hypothetical protein [Planctomycetota bacterium]
MDYQAASEHPSFSQQPATVLGTGLLALALLLAPAAATAQSGDLDILSSAVPPNVMVLFDNSGSMNHHLWDDDFNPEVVYPSFCWSQAPTVSGSSCPGYGNPGDECPNNETVGEQIDQEQSYTHCGVTRTLYHDNSTPQDTWYGRNYLNWLYGVADPADLLNEPQATRLQVAKDATTTVVSNLTNPTELIRFGVMKFNGLAGGYVDAPIGTSSGAQVISAVQGTQGSTWTPVGEALLDVGRYFAGSNQLGTLPLLSPSL